MRHQRDWPLSFHWTGIDETHLVKAGIPISGRTALRGARCSLVAELLIAAGSGRSWVSYARRPAYYACRRRYHGAAFTCRNMLRLVDELGSLGLINEDRACPGRLGWQSRIAASPVLLDRFSKVPPLAFDPVEVMRLKNAEGELIDYADTEETRRGRRRIQELNGAFASVRIGLPWLDRECGTGLVWVDGIAILTHKVAGYRVFKGSWTMGGRLYGPFWQTLPKSRRAQLTIDDSLVVEPDFHHLHPRLLYAQQGRQLGADAYTLHGFEKHRRLVKLGWQIMINAHSRSAAVRALANRLGGPRHYSSASAMLAALENHHDPIRRAFYSGVGLILQRIDADLMMKVEGRCLAEGIVALPVHDSFIVASTKQGQVEEFMEQELSITLRSLRF